MTGTSQREVQSGRWERRGRCDPTFATHSTPYMSSVFYPPIYLLITPKVLIRKVRNLPVSLPREELVPCRTQYADIFETDLTFEHANREETNDTDLHWSGELSPLDLRYQWRHCQSRCYLIAIQAIPAMSPIEYGKASETKSRGC